MNMKTAQNINKGQQDVVILILKSILPLALLCFGVILLALRIAGWSIILGLPMILFGFVFTVYTYDEIATKKYPTEPTDFVHCRICRRLTPIYPGMKKQDFICVRCQEEAERGMHRADL